MIVSDDGRVTVVDMDANDELMVTTDARIRAATLVAIPAFADARIGLLDGSELEVLQDETTDGDDELTSAGNPVAPPAEWFADPRLAGPTPVTVSEDGHVYGHLATWGTCHISHPRSCVTAPPSHADQW